MKAKGNNIKLFINEAEVTGFSFHKNYNNQIYITAGINLNVNGKTLTTTTLSSDSNKESPSYIPMTDEMIEIYDRLMEIVKKQAIISLERVQSLIE